MRKTGGLGNVGNQIFYLIVRDFFMEETLITSCKTKEDLIFSLRKYTGVTFKLDDKQSYDDAISTCKDSIERIKEDAAQDRRLKSPNEDAKITALYQLDGLLTEHINSNFNRSSPRT